MLFTNLSGAADRHYDSLLGQYERDNDDEDVEEDPEDENEEDPEDENEE